MTATGAPGDAPGDAPESGSAVALRLAASYAPRRLQPRYRGLFAFDEAIGRGALAAREPLMAQIRLAWWREACGRLLSDAPHPALAMLAQCWPDDPAPLVALVDGWEEVAVGEGAYGARAERLAQGRARACAAAAMERPDAADGAARCWTFATLSLHASDEPQRAAMTALAREARPLRLSRALRPLAVLDGLGHRAASHGQLLGDRMSPLAAVRLGIFGR